MKKNFDLCVHFNPSLKKLFMELKIAIFIIVVSVSNVFATPSYSQGARVSLDMKDKSLDQVMDEIEIQSDFYFIFNQKQIDINRVVDIEVNNKLITEVLPELFKGTNVNYAVFDKKILLTTDPLDKSILAQANITELQQNQIIGKVTDEKGNPIAGVTVAVKGTSLGTLTDATGKYIITNSPTNATLVFSFIGTAKQEIPVAGQTQIDVILKDEAIGLNEVVVIGYGTQRKNDLTGAVGQVKYDGKKNLPLVSVEQVLQGQVSGVKVKRNSGDPSGDFNISIRGVNSISNGGQPLYVVDGIPLAAGSVDEINPDDIKSMDVLKDASSSAIYGARAANGVVMITTKMGTEGGNVIDFSSEVGVQTPVLPFKMGDAFLQAQIVKESLTEEGITIPPELNDQVWLGENNHNWQKLATQNGYFQKYNISVSGGTEKTQYLVSAYYSNTEGVLINTNYKTGGFRLNLDNQVNDKLKVGARITEGIDGGNIGQTNGFWSVWKQTLMDLPWMEYKDANGNYLPISTLGVQAANSFDNPIAQMEENVLTQNRNSLVGNTYLEYNIIKGLTFKYSFGGEVHTERDYTFLPIYDHGAYSRRTTNVQDNQYTNTNWVSDATVSYDKDFKDAHKILVLA